jgi:hypothetical protein
LNNIKFSQITAKTNNSKNPILFPTKETREKLSAGHDTNLSLVGFECCEKGMPIFNFILSNGMKTDS